MNGSSYKHLICEMIRSLETFPLLCKPFSYFLLCLAVHVPFGAVDLTLVNPPCMRRPAVEKGKTACEAELVLGRRTVGRARYLNLTIDITYKP